MMEHVMRRKDRQLDQEEALRILRDGEHGILASVSKDNQPYGVPISYVSDDKNIYIHSALTGHKLDNIKHNSKVSFTVVEQGKPVFENNDFSTYYASAVVFGKAEIVEDEEEKTYALKILCEKYLPEYMGEFEKAMAVAGKATHVIKVSIDQLNGKAKK